jgi:hypothetical protein
LAKNTSEFATILFYVPEKSVGILLGRNLTAVIHLFGKEKQLIMFKLNVLMLDNSPLGRATIDTTPFYDDEFCRLAGTSSFSPC